MTRVNLGMDERVLDVGDSYSSVNPHVWAWLDTEFPGRWQIHCDNDGYYILFDNPDDATKFILTWL